MMADHIDVVIGVDTHKHSHAAAAVSSTGGVLGQVTAPANPAGYQQLLVFGHSWGPNRLWALEGTGSFGAGLCTALIAANERVVDVDRPKRPARRAGVKSDEIDAVRSARQALASDGIGEPRCRGDREAIRVLLSTRAQAVDIRTRSLNALHAMVTSAPDRLRERLRNLPTTQLLRTCASLRRSARQSAEEQATTTALRATARRTLACQTEAKDLETQLGNLVRRVAPSLLDQTGIGTVVAAQIIASWSHHGRVYSEAAFAKLAGVAPIEASSGTITRHRLDRYGDRQLNRALHTIVLIRMRQDPTTKTYVARRQAEGKTIREIRRCLKRYIARNLYRQLGSLPPTT